jgi:hypothetical protein
VIVSCGRGGRCTRGLTLIDFSRIASAKKLLRDGGDMAAAHPSRMRIAIVKNVIAMALFRRGLPLYDHKCA